MTAKPGPAVARRRRRLERQIKFAARQAAAAAARLTALEAQLGELDEQSFRAERVES